MTRQGSTGPWDTPVRVLLFAVVYWTTATFGHATYLPGTHVSAVWPPAGLAVAVLLRYGIRLWPGVALGGLAATLPAGVPLAQALGFCAADLLECLGCVALLRVARLSPALDRLRDVLILGVAGLVSAAVAAGVATGVVWATGGAEGAGATDLSSVWSAWWLADFFSILVITPVVLTWRVRGLARPSAEAVFVLGGLLATCWVVFAPAHGPRPAADPLPFLTFAGVTWAAARFGPAGAARSILLVTATAVVATVAGHGPFAAAAAHDGLAVLQAFLAVTAASGLLLGAAAAGQRRAVERADAARAEAEELVAVRTTELALVNQNLRDQRAVLRGVLDHIPCAVFWKDWAGVYQGCNAQAARDFGCASPDEVVGKTNFDFGFAPAEAESYTRYDRDLMASGRPALNLEETQTTGGVTKHVLTSKVPLRDAAGAVTGVLGVYADVTAWKRAELDRERFASLIENSSDFIGMATTTGEATYLNRAGRELVGLGDEEAVAATTIPDYLSPDSVALMQNEVLPGVLAGRQWVGELRLRHFRTGAPIDVLANVFLFRSGSADGSPCLATVMRDVTGRKRAEAVERKLLRDLGERVKELTALHRAARLLLSGTPETDHLLADLAALLPPAWQHADVAAARVAFDGREARTANWRPSPWRQSVAFVAADGRAGEVEVAYLEERPTETGGPFLAEEQGLLESVAEMLRAHLDHRASEEAVRASEGHHRALVESIPHLVWAARPDGHIDTFNGRALEYAGLRHEEGAGWGWEQVIHPDDRPRTLAVWTAALRAGRPHQVEYRLRRHDGAYRWHLARAVPVRDAGGRVTRWFGTCTDIDDQKRYEEELRRARAEAEAASRAKDESLVRLRESEARLAEAQEIARLGSFEQDLTTGRASWSDEAYRQLGYQPGDVEPSLDTVAARVHPDDRARFLADVEEANRTLGPFTCQFRVVRTDGAVRDHLVRGRYVLGPDGRPARLAGAVLDVTEREQAAAELRAAKEAAEAATRAKSEFLANMSHEIRTPMNGVLGMTELALGTDLTREQRSYLTTAKTSAEALLRVINDVLDFSKIEAGKMDLDPHPFSVRDALGDTVKALALRAQEKGLELTCRVAPAVPDALVGDALRVRQVLTNLVGNAVKFTNRGEVAVDVRTEAGAGDTVTLHVAVHDTGIGIPADKQAAVFEAFAQEDGSTARRFGGTGLGLAIAARLVGLMGGRIWVESAVGRGSTFHFTAALGRAPEYAPAPLPRGVDMEGLPVLVVDDNTTNRNILSELLAHWRMAPTAVASGFLALEELRRAAGAAAPYPLVLVDALMPGMDGFELIDRIRKEPGLAGATVLMLSSADRAGDVARCRELGVAVYLVKPVNPSELFDAVLTALGAAALRDPTAAEGPAATDPVPARRLRVLVAEDNEVNQALAATMLGKRGHAVVLAGDGRAAVAAWEREDFDVVLMDVQMPGMDGFEATVAIRERERETGRRTPIVALTAHAMKGDREWCLAAGMDDYLTKPLSGRELSAALARLGTPTAGAAPTTTPATGKSVPVFDRAAALARVEGDDGLLRKMAGLFVRQADKLLADVRAAAAAGDGPALNRAAHKLNGSAGNFGAARAADAAFRLESLGRGGDPTGSAPLVAELENEVARLRAALDGLLTEEAVCGS